MRTVIVVDRPEEWPFKISGVDVIDDETYLTDPALGASRRVRLFNLCRSYRYQSSGYYVTLLATARGHRPVPDLVTIQDLKSQTQVRLVSDELDDLIQRSLKSIRSRDFDLSVYFGHNLAKRYDQLSVELFNLLEAPLVRAHFIRPNGKWILRGMAPIPLGDIPPNHLDFVHDRAREYFSVRKTKVARPKPPKYKLGILINPEEKDPPSNEAAIEKFIQAADDGEMAAERIQREDFSRVEEFDALFIRETTQVNHYTYRFARKAATAGLAVIDDPESILKCSNKVYLAELLTRERLPIPRTLIVHRGNIDAVVETLGFPCILKLPDGAFSRGVVKVEDEESLRSTVAEFLSRSDLIIAQEYLLTSFDWRVGVWNRKPLFACRYHMAKDHWQIIKRDKTGRSAIGRVDNVILEECPRTVIDCAMKAASLIGDGLYGVDLKDVEGDVKIIEINDNPNLDSGNEDQALGDELYRRIVSGFIQRIEKIRA